MSVPLHLALRDEGHSVVADGSAALSALRVDVNMIGHVEKGGGGTGWKQELGGERRTNGGWTTHTGRRMEEGGDVMAPVSWWSWFGWRYCLGEVWH